MQAVGLVPIRGWPHRVTRASIHLREATPTVLSNHPPSCTGGVGRSVRCGCQAPPGRPHHVRQRAYCIVKPPPVLYRGGGEKCLQLQVFVTRPWCGPRGYIQVGMRGRSGRGSRRGPQKLRSVPLHRFSLLCLFAIQAPSQGGVCMGIVADARRNCAVSFPPCLIA